MNIAILDYDNTLSKGYSRYEHGYAMEREGIIAKGLEREVETLQRSYEQGDITYNQKFADDKKIFTKYYKGIKMLDMIRFLENDFDLEALMFPSAKELIKMLKEHGYLTVVVSGCWDFIIEHAQQILGFDSFIATEFEHEKGVLTGGYKQIVNEDVKRKFSVQLLSKSENSLGFGDSVADFEFLTRVNQGFLIDPKEDAVEAVKKYPRIKVVKEVELLQTVKSTLTEQ